MTGEAPFTHSLGRFADECRPWVYRWYPELASPKLAAEVEHLADMLGPDMDRAAVATLIQAWLSRLIVKGICQAEYEIGQIPQDDHESKPPYDELVAMMGTDENVIVIDCEEDSDGPV